MPRPIIAVIGGRKTEKALLKEAEEAGRLIAERDAVLVCGGLGGVMEASARGARFAGGLTEGILPHDHKGEANGFIDFPVVTGMGMGRNVIIARTADGFIAIGGEYVTLSENCLCLIAWKACSWNQDLGYQGSDPCAGCRRSG